jgi:hypothetical protein
MDLPSEKEPYHPMSSEEMTDWFPRDVRPEHVGIYEVLPPGKKAFRWFAFWNGLKWGMPATIPRIAMTNMNPHMAMQNKIWRGFKEQQR